MKRSFQVTKLQSTHNPRVKRRKVVRRRLTTLQLNPDGPFPRALHTKLIYENALTSVAPGAIIATLGTKPNSAYDYDNSSGAAFGNKQPLYYDALMTASGPYRNYKVNSWKTTYTIINSGAASVTCFALPPIAAPSEIDSLAEADNFPGVKRVHLTAATGSKNIGTITVYGDVADVYPSSALSEGGMIAAYNADPTYLVYGGLIIASGDGTTNVTVQVAVRHEMNCVLQAIDALVS